MGVLGYCCCILAMSPVMTIQAGLESGICDSYTKQDQQDTFMQLTSGWSCQPRTLMVPPLPRLFLREGCRSAVDFSSHLQMTYMENSLCLDRNQALLRARQALATKIQTHLLRYHQPGHPQEPMTITRACDHHSKFITITLSL